jgi:RND family efflux transporter MFP subunit
MRELFKEFDWGGRWSWILALGIAGVAAAGWTDGGRQAIAVSSKSTVSIECTDHCKVLLIDEAILTFERPGILGAIDIREGDLVKAGQFLAKLKDDVAKATLAVAEETAASDIDIRYAVAAADIARSEVERMEAANRRTPGAVPELEVDRTRLNAIKTALEVEKAQHTRDVNVLKKDEAAAQLATYWLEAPFDGFVSRVHLTKGASVKQGDPVIKLVSTRKMKVEGQVKLRDAALLRPGARVSVELVAPEEAGVESGKAFPGKLVFIDVESTPLSPTVRVWAEVENVDNLLRAGLKAKMTILPSKGE